MLDNCLICNSTKLQLVFQSKDVPLVPNAPLDISNFDTEIFVDLNIVQCQHCSLIYNKAFDAALIDKIYTSNYSSGMPSSQSMMERCKIILDDLILKKNIENQCVIEIGASDFTFSELLLDRGASQVIAFEPSELFSTTNPRIHHIHTFFSLDKLPVPPEDVGLIVMRHVLEHVPQPLETLEELARIAQPGLKLYIEVPNAEDIIEQNRFYDFFYEHVTYFNPDLLTKVLQNLGFTIRQVAPLVQGQHFGLLCEKTEPTPKELPAIQPSASLQAVDSFREYTDKFLKQLQEVMNSYDRVAIYGAGNHGLGVAALLELDAQRVKCFLDLNKMKAGKYSPKTHIPILPPDAESLQDLEAIVIIAPLHQDEIASDLRRKFGLTREIWGTYPDIFRMD